MGLFLERDLSSDAEADATKVSHPFRLPVTLFCFVTHQVVGVECSSLAVSLYRHGNWPFLAFAAACSSLFCNPNLGVLALCFR